MATLKVLDGGPDAIGTYGSQTATQTTFTAVTVANAGTLATTKPWMDYVSPTSATTIVVPTSRLVSVV